MKKNKQLVALVAGIGIVATLWVAANFDYRAGIVYTLLGLGVIALMNVMKQ